MFESAFSKKKSSEEDHFYLSKEGYITFTEKYHLNRGYCCKNNCKHCPFGYDKKTG
jgi:2-iminoacetate synthase ThiH